MKEKSSPLGIDMGTSRIVVAERQGDEMKCRSQLNAFVSVPFSRITQKTLTKEGIPHLVENCEILVYGDQAETFADLFHLDTRRPMSRGVLNPGEPNGLVLIGQILRDLASGQSTGRKLCFSVPAPPIGSGDNVTYHEAALRQLFSDLGFEARAINEGLAVIYAELEKSHYTGIGISFGGGLCNVCLAYLSAPLFSFSVPKAGDFIDTSVAAVTGELTTRVRITKESSFHFNGSFSDKIQQALGVYYADIMDAVVEALTTAFSDSRNVPKIGRPVPVVLSGGSVLPAGFSERFERRLREAALPIQIAEVLTASDPLNTTAKGALVAALADE